MAKILRTEHIAVNVTKMDETIKFYTDILELKKISDEEMDGEFLDTVQAKSNMKYRIVKLVSPEGFMVEFLQDLNHEVAPHKKDTLQDAGIRHYAYEVDDVDGMYEKVTKAGCPVVSVPSTSEDGHMRLFFVRDPEDNLIELMQFF